MSNTKTIIVIWGAAILIYLAVVHSSGSVSVLNSLGNLVSSNTKTLQGR